VVGCEEIYFSNELLSLRAEINKIDKKILELIKRRIEISKKIGKIKKKLNLPIYDPVREREIYNKVCDYANKNGLNSIIVKDIFSKILELSKIEQEKLLNISYKVGVLGPLGTYSDECALKIFKSRNRLKYYDSIEDIFKAVDSEEVKYGLVPIENTYGGTVVQTLECLIKYNVYVVGEYMLDINHCLVSKRHMNLKDIKVVYSHPQAIIQCQNFLKSYLSNAKIKYTNSTADAINLLDNKSAAITSETAAMLNDCVILKKGIQDSKLNKTKFYLISKKPSDGNITALLFSVEDKPGALKKVLDIFYKYKINLRKLESRPDKQNIGRYIFFTEAEQRLDKKIIEKIKKQVIYFKNLGSFNPINDFKDLLYT
jgi:chorismate mutase/prephenate dehydratase